jgi:hypothetical protein
MIPPRWHHELAATIITATLNCGACGHPMGAFGATPLFIKCSCDNPACFQKEQAYNLPKQETKICS